MLADLMSNARAGYSFFFQKNFAHRYPTSPNQPRWQARPASRFRLDPNQTKTTPPRCGAYPRNRLRHITHNTLKIVVAQLLNIYQT